jgi:large repetitive protein
MREPSRSALHFLKHLFIALALTGALVATACRPSSNTSTTNPPSLSVTTSLLPSATVNVAYPSASLAASGGTGPYSWSVTVGNLPDGLTLDSSTGAITGTPTVVNTFSFTVKVQDSHSATATKVLSITINPLSSVCPSGSESKLHGQYAFQMQGFDASGPVVSSGSFDADGAGHIGSTVGVVDINRSSGVANLAIDSANSSYKVGSDNRGCLTIATSAGTSVFRISLGKFSSNIASQGHLVEFDSTGTLGSGIIEQQDPNAFSNAQINGNYAFGVSSTLSLTTRSRFGAAGSFLASAGVITAGAVDTNLDGNADDTSTTTWPASPLSFTGAYSISSNGRGTLTLNIGTTVLQASIYVVSAQKLLIMSIDPQTTNPLFAGIVLQQSGTPFFNGSLNANSVIYASGVAAANPLTSDILEGILSFPSSGSFSRTADENNGGTLTSLALSGTYNVDMTTGRVTTTAPKANHPPAIWYLVSENKGFVLGADDVVATGFFEPQTGGSFTNASANGSYSFGVTAPMTPNVSNESGVAMFDGAGTVGGTTDSSSLGSGLSGNQAFFDTYSIASTGRGTIGSGNILYIISPTKAILMDATSANSSLEEAGQ